MYALVDCNNFYVSCERLFQPWLNNTPIAVLSNNDGCIIARSQEVKNMGIKMGEPAFKLKEVFEKNHVLTFSSNYTLYGDISQRVMHTLANFSPDIEIYSIDEAFLSFHGMNRDLVAYARQIKNIVMQNIGIPVGIGIGPTKTLAKVANYFAKKDKENDGIFYIDTTIKPNKEENPSLQMNKQDKQYKEIWGSILRKSPIEENNLDTISRGHITTHLQRIPVEEIWGIGRSYANFLNKNGIFNAYQFTNLDDNWIQRNMTIAGLRIKKELQGLSCIPLELLPQPKKAIATTRSFGTMIDDIEILRQAVSNFASKCAYKLRMQGSICNAILVFVTTNRHRKDLKQYSNSIVIKCNIATSSTIEIVKNALMGLNKVYKKGFKYKKAGVIVSDIVPENQVQTSLFDNIDREKHDNLMKSVDHTNFKIGREKVKLSSCGNSRKWRLKKEKISQCYTTRWDELIHII